MLFHVSMTVRPPHDIDPQRLDALKSKEKARCQTLMDSGVWLHIWRVVGQYRNVSIFDASSHAELHDILSTLPLFPFMEICVTALCRHPSSIRDDES
jgi:muconolactone D-isomerase